jgi:hypothetical protein
MSAGCVLGSDRTPEAVLAVRVGGPLSSLRAEAVALHQLLMTLLSSPIAVMAPLVFVDNLILLHILDHWGRLNYHPGPTEVIHFDVIMQLLGVLRQWHRPIRLVKGKSLSGCLMNDRSDEQAECGYKVETPKAFPAPPKFTSLTLRVHNPVRELTSECKTSIPRDNAHNCKILRGVISTNLRRAANKRNTIFVNQLLRRNEGATIARVVSRCKEAEYSVWVKMMSGRYSVQIYLHQVKLAASPDCPFCPGITETLNHFTCLCPQFREARIAATIKSDTNCIPPSQN